MSQQKSKKHPLKSFIKRAQCLLVKSKCKNAKNYINNIDS
jgi:hypothetical protein